MSSTLPAQASLEHLKHQAKAQLTAHADRSPECLPVLRHLHRFKNADDQAVFAAELKLADVQFALAMEYGFTTWDELSRHVQDRSSGLGERAARAWARLRRHADLAKMIGGEATSVKDGSWMTFIVLHLEGPLGRFRVEEAAPGDRTHRLRKQQRLGEFLIAAGIQAPRITLLEVDGMTYGVHPEITGESLGSVKASPAEWDLFVTQMADLLGRMHAVPLAEACRILELPASSPEEAAAKSRFGGYLDVDVIEAALAKELDADRALYDLWLETRAWITTFVSTPADLVFGHGDMWLHGVQVAKTPEGYRLSGIGGLHNAGLVNLYDEFLRVGELGLFEAEGMPVGRRIIEAYNSLPGQTRRVEWIPLRHAIRAFWFYLAHEQSGEDRAQRLASAKRSQRMW